MTRKISTKKQLEAIREEFQLKALQRAKKVLEMQSASDFWLTSYTDVLDRYRDGNQIVYPLSNPNDRRAGSNFPFWISESQLAIIRASSRLIVTMNPAAYGLINGLTSYVIGSGFNYKATVKENSGGSPELALAVQKIMDRFIDEQDWKGMEQELFFRSREDGEAFLRLFPQPNGKLQVRTVEPEQVIQPPNSTFDEWSYGIQTDVDDVFDIKNYYVHYLAPGGANLQDNTMGEIVPVDQIIHIKVNVKRGIKRGLPDLSFDTLETFSLASKLRRNMGEGAAVQAAIAAVRQHDTASASQVETFVQSTIDYSMNIPFNGRYQDYSKIDAGSFLDIPKGMNYIPPPGAANASAHLSIHSALLRAAGTRHNAPEWLVSGDASNNNYASSLTAESPFLRNCQRLQSLMGRPFKQVMTTAIQTAIDAGRLPADTLKMIEISVTPPTVETRNRGEEASSNQTYVNLGVKSRQKVAQELGLDWAKEAAEMEQYNKRFGGEGGGEKKPPTGPGPSGPDGKPAPKVPPKPSKAPEGLTEGKYDHIDFTPPKGAREAAKRALEVRAEKPDSQQGMTAVGIARARDLSNGKTLSPETVRRMKAYFDRHQSDKSGESWDEQGKGWQAWMGWGGDPGYAWARKVVRQMDSADRVTEGWVTIGANKKKGETEKKGGTHVFINNATGRIEKGPSHTVGRRPKELKHLPKQPPKLTAPMASQPVSSPTGISGISFKITKPKKPKVVKPAPIEKPVKNMTSKPKKPDVEPKPVEPKPPVAPPPPPPITPPATPSIAPPISTSKPKHSMSDGFESKPTDFTPKKAEQLPELKRQPSNFPKPDRPTDNQLEAVGRANAVETHRHSITGTPSFKLTDGTVHKIEPIENLITQGGSLALFASLFSENWKKDPALERGLASRMEFMFAQHGSDFEGRSSFGSPKEMFGKSRELFRDTIGGELVNGHPAVIDDYAGPNLKKYPELLKNSHFAHYKQEFDKEMARPTESVISDLEKKYGGRVAKHFNLLGDDGRTPSKEKVAMASVAMQTYEKLADNAHPIPKKIAEFFPEIAGKSVKNLIAGWDTHHGKEIENLVREASRDTTLSYIRQESIDEIKAATSTLDKMRAISKAIRFNSGVDMKQRGELVAKYTEVSDEEANAKAKEMYGKSFDQLLKKYNAQRKDPSKMTNSEYSEFASQQGEAKLALYKEKNELFLRDHASATDAKNSNSIDKLMESLKRKDSHKQLLSSKIGDSVQGGKINVSNDYKSEVEKASKFVDQYSEIPIHDLVFFSRADGVRNGYDMSPHGQKNCARGFCSCRTIPETGTSSEMFKDQPVIFTPDVKLTAKRMGFDVSGSDWEKRLEPSKPHILGNINSTLVHEIGHAIETSDRFVRDMVNNFLIHRVGDEKPKQLKKVFPGTKYRDDEVGRKDNFDKAFEPTSAWYCGKDYPHKTTEILSMGIQKMRDDPKGFFTKDPEYAKFIMSVLQYKSVHEKMREGSGA